jgi:YHS domain-containing protein
MKKIQSEGRKNAKLKSKVKGSTAFFSCSQVNKGQCGESDFPVQYKRVSFLNPINLQKT